jgi:pyruvate,orthophosphate dikinase
LHIAAVEAEVAAILTRLLKHDARETELLGAALGVDPAEASVRAPTPSRALEVNLRRTAVDVVVPAGQQVLLEITADRYGVHENTKKLLREINHPYVGWAETLDDLHQRAMGDFAHYIDHDRAAEAIDVFCELYAKAAEEASSVSLQETAVRDLLYYLVKVVRDSGERLPSVLPCVDRARTPLSALLRRRPRLAMAASPRLRRLAEALLAAAPDAASATTERSLALLAQALREVYALWLARADPADWWRERVGAGPQAPLPEPMAAISHARIRAYRQRLDRSTRAEGGQRRLVAEADVLLALPDSAAIEHGYLEAASCLESSAHEPWRNQAERIHWLIRLLSVEALSNVHEQALTEINHRFVSVLRGAEPTALGEIVREAFAALRRSEIATLPSALQLVSKIGATVLASGDPDRAAAMIDEMLDWDFPQPGFSGFTEEWQVRVDAAHLRTIRAHLAVVEANPELARRLIAGSARSTTS